MKFNKTINLFAVSFVVLTALNALGATTRFQSVSYRSPNNSCEQVGRNSALCYEMKHIRSLLNVMESQSDLMRANYPLIKNSADDMNQVISSMLVRNSFGPHLAYIQNVQSTAKQLSQDAAKSSLNTFQTLGVLRANCQSCHSAEAPPSGHAWDEIASGHWATLTSKCRDVGRNPYICRSMFSLLMSLNYFSASYDSAHESHKMVAELAKEIIRLADDLESKKAVHAPELPFSEIKDQATELLSLSLAADPTTFDRSRAMQSTCMRCHGL